MRKVKCFFLIVIRKVTWNQKGHLAKMCPLPRKYSKRVTEYSSADPWFHGVFVTNAAASESQVSSKGPTYKVDIIVGGVLTRGLLSPGYIGKERVTANDKRKTSSHSYNLPLDVQPIGASGLGAIALVLLPIEVEEMGASKLIPCYVLKPTWQREVRRA